jgi:ATP-dependent Lhr-like helicase
VSAARCLLLDRPLQKWPARRQELGDLLRRPGPAVCIEDSAARWWTFAGGRINHTLKYRLELAEGWKVVADNFALRIEGDGITHDSVRHAITQLSAADSWAAPATRRARLARLPAYRLSKFQDCLPEAYALEVIERFLLDVDGARSWLQGMGG